MSIARNEEIFESPDVPPPEMNFRRDELRNPENVELIHIDIDSARNIFQGRLLKATDVDFSDSIDQRGKKSYGSTGYVLEVVGKDYSEPETPEQKFNRLLIEIEELDAEISKEGSSLKTGASVDALKNMLMHVKDPKEKSTKTSTKQAAEADDAVVLSLASTGLEKRVKRLEELIGSLPAGSRPLVDVVEDLMFRMSVLNPAFCEAADQKLIALLDKLKQVEKQEAPSDEVQKKVDEILALMTKWDGVCTTLPSQNKKLQALSRLHEFAQQASGSLDGLLQMRKVIEKDIASNRETVDDLRSIAKNDLSTVIEKIKKLEAKLSTLGK